MNEPILFAASVQEPEPIPELKTDLANISKLPDMPRAYNGWPTQKFKEAFDKAGLDIQTYLNTVLVPALIAGRIPFTPTSDIPKGTIQEAIMDVQKQVVEAAAGTIPNGSVGLDKLSEEAVKRTWGGVPWVSLDAPTAADTIERGFPIGQEWISPRFELTNVVTDSWTVTNGKAVTSPNKVVFSGDKTLATVTALQNAASAGQAGDRGYVIFSLGTKDPEITSITVSVNGQPAVSVTDGENVIEAPLGSSQAATVLFTATWPTASVADGSFEIDNLTAVNVDTVRNQLPGVIDKVNWAAYLRTIIPFETSTSEFSGWVHVTNGKWSQEVFEILPMNRGGTGLSDYAPGQMLYVGEDGKMQKLDKVEGAYLQFSGTPVWKSKEEVLSDIGALRIKTGTYTGDGLERAIDLGIAPKLLHIQSLDGPGKDNLSNERKYYDNAFVISNGGNYEDLISAPASGGGYRAYFAGVRLKDNNLSFYFDKNINIKQQEAFIGNRKTIRYAWTAIY